MTTAKTGTWTVGVVASTVSAGRQTSHWPPAGVTSRPASRPDAADVASELGSIRSSRALWGLRASGWRRASARRRTSAVGHESVDEHRTAARALAWEAGGCTPSTKASLSYENEIDE